MVGALVPGPPPKELHSWATFFQPRPCPGAEGAGYVDGQNVAIEYRFADSHYDRLPAFATDLVGRNVDVIVTSSTPGALAAKHATALIPIVFVVGGDPVENGLVASLARPGGNLTGFTNVSVELMPKLLDLLSELVPRASTIALLANPNNPVTKQIVRGAQDAAQARGMSLFVHSASTEDEIDVAFASLAQEQVSSLLVEEEPLFDERHQQITALAARIAIPAIFGASYASGGLFSYSADVSDLFRNAGIYAGRIMEGARPADLPVQQPTLYRLVVNLKVARTLGLTVPQSILARANEVIE